MAVDATPPAALAESVVEVLAPAADAAVPPTVEVVEEVETIEVLEGVEMVVDEPTAVEDKAVPPPTGTADVAAAAAAMSPPAAGLEEVVADVGLGGLTVGCWIAGGAGKLCAP
jgi:methyl coenzyme M reductase alpha subunit